MADKKITELTALGAAPASGDLVPIVDVSDTTDSPQGTTKKVAYSDLVGTGGYAGVTTGGTGSLDMAQGTKTADEPFIDGTVTWNDSGVTFSGIVINCIDTASASGSRLLWLRKSGSTMFEFLKSGSLNLPESGAAVTIAQNGQFRWSSAGRLASGTTNNLKVLDSAGNPATIDFGERTPGALSTTENNYDWGSTGYFLRLTANASNTSMTGGRSSGQAGEVHLIVNIAAAGTLTLVHESASSNAAQRFLNSTGADIVLSPNQAADLIYDSVVQRWRVFKRN